MKHYGLKIAEGTQITNTVVATGTSFPSNEDAGELFYRTDQNKLYVYAGSSWSDITAGGSGISNIVEDTTPQLGGNLDAQNNNISMGSGELQFNALILNEGNGDINTDPDIRATGSMNVNAENSIHIIFDNAADNSSEKFIVGKGSRTYSASTTLFAIDNDGEITSTATGTGNYMKFVDATTGVNPPYIGALGDELILQAPGGTTSVTISDNLIVTGNLTVQGTTTTIDSNTVNIGDNIIVLNSDETGVPSQNAGIEVERGTLTNSQLIWDEVADKWRAYNGTSWADIWTADNQGTGSGMDADTVDSKHATDFWQIDENVTSSSVLDITSNSLTASLTSTRADTGGDVLAVKRTANYGSHIRGENSSGSLWSIQETSAGNVLFGADQTADLILDAGGNDIQFRPGASVSMHIDNSGAVRVGRTTDVGYTSLDRLVVSDSTSTGIVIESTGGNNTALAFSDGSTLDARLMYESTGDYLTFQVADNDRMAITSAGRILMGSTTDDGTNRLQVNGSAKATKMVLEPINYASSQSFEGLRVQTIGGTNWVAGFGLESAAGGTNSTAIYAPSDSSGNWSKVWETYAAAQNHQAWFLDGSELMRLEDSGELLLGFTTSQGSYALQVNGSIYNDADIVTDGKIRTDWVAAATNEHLVLSAGESHSYLTGLTGERVYAVAEGGLAVISSTDNWVGGWANRNDTVLINTADGESIFPGDVAVGTTSTVSGYGLTVSGGLYTTGSSRFKNNSTDTVVIDKDANTDYAGLDFRIADESNWLLYSYNDGSGDLGLQARDYTNNGAYKGTVFSVDWDTMVLDFKHHPTINGATFWTSSNDGASSGLDADLLDGIQGTNYARTDINETFSGSVNAPSFVTGTSTLRTWSSADTDIDALIPGTSSGVILEGLSNAHVVIGVQGNDSNDGFYIIDNSNTIEPTTYAQLVLAVSNSTFEYKGNEVWHAGNDGSGSGLDADTVDNIQASSFVRGDGGNNGTVTIETTDSDFVVRDVNASGVTNFIYRDHSGDTLYLGAADAVVTLRSELDANSFKIHSVPEIGFQDIEPSALTADGDVGFDSSRGLIVYRTQTVGDETGSGTYTVLDTSNIAVTDGLTVTNTAAGTSGTEAITFGLGNISGAIGNAAVAGAVGTYVFARNYNASNKDYGDTVAGSDLTPTNASASNNSTATLSGTWRCLGYALGSGSSEGAATLWVRIS